MSKDRWYINEVLQILLIDIGLESFIVKPKNIKVDFLRRKTYEDLWIVSELPWEREYSVKPQIPRKWNQDDTTGFKFYIEDRYNQIVSKAIIIDAIKCLKNRCKFLREDK